MDEDFKKIYDFENLYRAHKMARRGKQVKRDVIKYEMHLSENIQRLSYHLKTGTYRVGEYNKFTIYDPKKREIQAPSYNDRVLQHCLCDNVLGPYVDCRLIYDNAACRKGKGSHFAMDRVSSFLRQFYKKHGCEGYILKCDIRKYFNSVYHPVLKTKIKQMKLDQKTRWLMGQIVDSYEYSPNRGLPMGNQTSQWFALYYLNDLDHMIKEKLGIKYYSRYMDDMILIHEDKEYLQECLRQMSKYLNESLCLEFNEKTQIHHIRNGVDYLGFHFYMTESGKVVRTLRQSGKKKIKKKLRSFKHLYKEGRINTEQIGRSLVSMRGHLLHGNTWNLRNNIYHNFVLTKSKEQNDSIMERDSEGGTNETQSNIQSTINHSVISNDIHECKCDGAGRGAGEPSAK